MTDDQIKTMVDRFLAWKLPADFAPDAGIKFDPVFNKGTPYEMRHEPTGTNLFHAQQAEAMVRHMVEGIAAPQPEAAPQEQPSDDGALTQALKERDDAEDMADQLAAQIAAITGEEIGEHSSANDPWHNAMLAADEFIAVQIRNLFSPPTAPKEFDADDMQEQWNAAFAAGRAAPQAGEDAQPAAWKTECIRLIDCFNDLVSPTLPSDEQEARAALNALIAHVEATPQPALQAAPAVPESRNE